jgi:hypothetical protein
MQLIQVGQNCLVTANVTVEIYPRFRNTQNFQMPSVILHPSLRLIFDKFIGPRNSLIEYSANACMHGHMQTQFLICIPQNNLLHFQINL